MSNGAFQINELPCLNGVWPTLLSGHQGGGKRKQKKIREVWLIAIRENNDPGTPFVGGRKLMLRVCSPESVIHLLCFCASSFPKGPAFWILLCSCKTSLSFPRLAKLPLWHPVHSFLNPKLPSKQWKGKCLWYSVWSRLFQEYRNSTFSRSWNFITPSQGTK